MRILDIVNGMWAMPGARVEELQALYYAHTRREKLDLKAWEAASGRPAGEARSPYQLTNGVAVIPIQGVMTKVDSAWNRICGMTSTALVQQDLQAALADPMVHSILLWIDSPGGMVDGTQELAQAVFAARGQKPIVSLADGCMCSAALWVGEAAEQVFITSDTTEVGSIGVVTSHTDISGQEAQAGRKTTVLSTGKYKRIAHQHAPLSAEGADYITSQLDHITTIFVDSIAKFRGVSVDTVLADMADGRVFLGQQAIDAGLVDGVSTMADLIVQLNHDRNARTPGAGVASLTSTKPQQENQMGNPTGPEAADSGMVKCPDCGKKFNPDQNKASVEDIQKEAATAELDRVKGCLDASMPGYEAVATTFALDGKTQPGAAAQAIIAAQKVDQQAARAKAATGAPALPGTADPQVVEDAAAAATRAEAEKPEDATALAAKITAHMTKAAAEGRTLTSGQALAELTAQGKE